MNRTVFERLQRGACVLLCLALAWAWPCAARATDLSGKLALVDVP